MKIISLVPSQTELLHYLGLGDKVVGITKFCIHPNEWYRTKTRVGGTKTVDFDKIKQLQPDWIIANKEENTKSEIEALQRDYNVWMSDILTVEDALQMILSLGELLDVLPQSEALVAQLRLDFKDLETNLLKHKKQKAAYFIWQEPYMVAASNTFIHEMLGYAGFENVFANLERYPEITAEILQTAQPEVILLSSEPFPFKEKHVKQFQEICPDAKVQVVDGEMFSWYGSRMLGFKQYVHKLM